MRRRRPASSRTSSACLDPVAESAAVTGAAGPRAVVPRATAGRAADRSFTLAGEAPVPDRRSAARAAPVRATVRACDMRRVVADRDWVAVLTSDRAAFDGPVEPAVARDEVLAGEADAEPNGPRRADPVEPCAARSWACSDAVVRPRAPAARPATAARTAGAGATRERRRTPALGTGRRSVPAAEIPRCGTRPPIAAWTRPNGSAVSRTTPPETRNAVTGRPCWRNVALRLTGSRTLATLAPANRLLGTNT